MLKKTGKASLQIIDPYGTRIAAVNGLINKLQEEGWRTEYKPTGQQPQEDVDTCGYRVAFWVEQYLADERANKISKISAWNPPDTSNSIIQAVATSMGVQVKTKTQQINKETTRTQRTPKPQVTEMNKKEDMEKQKVWKKTQKRKRTETQPNQTKPNVTIRLQAKAGMQTPKITIKSPKMPINKPKPEEKRRKARQEKTKKYGKSIHQEWKAEVRAAKDKTQDRKEGVREVRQTAIYTHNMQGGWTGAKRQLITEWLATTQPGTLMIQEPHITSKEDTQWYMYGAPYQVITHVGNDQQETGLITLVHNKIAHRICHKKIQKDGEGRMLAVPITTYNSNKLLWFINIYGPATDKEKSEEGEDKKKHQRQHKKNFWDEKADRFMHKVREAGSQEDMWIIGTDANAVKDVQLDTNWEEAQRNKTGSKENRVKPNTLPTGV